VVTASILPENTIVERTLPWGYPCSKTKKKKCDKLTPELLINHQQSSQKILEIKLIT
jgi:hypothetical protein